MTPSQIKRKFIANWNGTEEQLDALLEAFYEDIRDSYDIAIQHEVLLYTAVLENIHITVSDYVSNHYFN